MMDSVQLYNRMHAISEYYFDKLEDVQNPMDALDLQWYVNDSMMSLLKELYEDFKQADDEFGGV